MNVGMELYMRLIAMATAQTGKTANEIRVLWWNNYDGKLNGMVEIDGQRVRIGGTENEEKWWRQNDAVYIPSSNRPDK